MKRQINEILKKYDLQPVNRQYGNHSRKLASSSDMKKNSFGVIKGTPYTDTLFIKSWDEWSGSEFVFSYEFHPNFPIRKYQLLENLENDIKKFKNNIEK